MCVCVCVCVCARARAGVRVCVVVCFKVTEATELPADLCAATALLTSRVNHFLLSIGIKARHKQRAYQHGHAVRSSKSKQSSASVT